METIRIFGDPVLHQPPMKVDFANPVWDLDMVLKVMQKEYMREAGVGIAANQCAELANPPQMIIVGVADPEVRKRAQKRYPGQAIPEPMVLINPEILEYSLETYFPANGEGCISVRGALRAKVPRHEWVLVRYHDMEGTEHIEKFSGFTAHIVQHECDHLNGLVYLEKILHELHPEQRQALLALSKIALLNQHDQKLWPPQLGFSRDQSGKVVLESEVLLQELGALEPAVLTVLIKRLSHIDTK